MTNEEIYESSRKRLQLHPADDDGRLLTESKRHSGTFRSDNPYLKNLQRASTKQDEDAAFELAVLEEAKLADYYRERADKRADLEEQRAYDDPLAVIGRNRRAGINTDLLGGSSGTGSSSGSAVAQMPSMQTATEHTTPFASVSQNTGLLFQGFQTIASVMSAIASFGTSVVGAVDTITMLPKKREQLDLQNDSQEIQNDSLRLGLVNDKLGMLNQLTNLITPDTTDEDGLNLLTSLGLGSDIAPSHLKTIRHLQKHPEFLAKWEESEARRIANEAYNEVYTKEVKKGAIQLSADLESVGMQLQFHQDDFKLKVAKLVNTDENANAQYGIFEQTQQNERQTLNNESDQIELVHRKIQQDMAVYEKQVKLLKTAIDKSNDVIGQIKAKGCGVPNFKTGAVKLIGEFYYTPEQVALIQKEEQRILSYETMGSQFLGNLHSMMLDSYKTAYFNRRFINYGGDVSEYALHPDRSQFLNTQFTFSNYVNGECTSSDLFTNIINMGVDMAKFFLNPKKAAGTTINNFIKP